jgi:fructose-bisphosphate aldolase/6-deoxy-5-ketofructose 1-phosphate synthase
MFLKNEHNLNILGIGYTIFLGSEYEAEMFEEVSRLILDAHKHGLICVLWIYPRGKGVLDEKDPDLIAGACGVALCLGADFVKVNYPKINGKSVPEKFKQAINAAGRCGVVCAGGSKTSPKEFFDELYEQIHVCGVRGNATGRNVHQRDLKTAIRMCNAIYSITVLDYTPEHALKIYNGDEEL